MFFSIFYEIALFCLSLVYFPKMLYQRIRKGKYRDSLFKRFGKDFPKIEKGQRPLIWIHGVSVGEIKAVAETAKSLLEKNPEALLLISSVTETGHLEAKKSLPFAHYHVFLPFDFKWIISPLMKKVRPDLVLLCESDFWYNFMACAKREGAKIALINGKMSLRSYARFHKFSFISSRLFSLIDLFCVQGKEYQQRFISMNIPQEKIVVTGNIKLDADEKKLSDEEKQNLRKRLGIQEDDFVLVAGSTHDPEEKIILEAALALRSSHPKLKVIFVPRHPTRFSAVALSFKAYDIPFHRLSDKEPKTDSFVILVDAMGLLRDCYQIANVAIVGGSFTKKVGGHNIIEPCFYGVPVVFGPYLFTQPDFLFLVNEYGAGLQTDESGLTLTLQTLFNDQKQRNCLGMRGLSLVKEMGGAREKTLKTLSRLKKVLC